MLADALEHLVRGIVDHPDDVTVRDKQLRRGSILEVRVHPDDLGKVIGRGGRTATAFRTVVSALAGRGGARIDFVDVDRAPLTASSHALADRASPLRGGARFVRSRRRVRTLSGWSHRVRAVDSIDVVVGRIGKPHGLRGEVTVDVRTDEPERRFADGAVLRVEAPPGSADAAADPDRGRAPAGTSACCWSTLRGARRPRRRRGRPRHRCCTPTIAADETPEDPDEFYDHQLVGLAAYDVDGARARRGHAPSCTAPPRTCSASGRPTAATRWCRSSRRWCPRSTSPAGRVVVADRPGLVRPAARRRLSRDAHRRRHDLPRLPRPAASCRSPGKARETGPARPRACTTCGDWTHDRHRTVDDTPYGGGAGMVMKPEPWGEAFDALGRRGRDRRRADAGGAAVHPGRWPASWPPATGWSSRAAATRASTSGSSTHAAARTEVREVSLGDYVLNGGEVAALAITEAVVRLLPGFMGNAESLVEESHEDGLLEYPVYTKPAVVARPRRARRCCCRGDHARDRRLAARRRPTAPYGRAPPRPAARQPVRAATSQIRAAASRADAGELLTLQRACWVAGGSMPTRGVGIPALHETLDDVLRLAREAWTVLRRPRSPGRLVGAVRGRARRRRAGTSAG